MNSAVNWLIRMLTSLENCCRTQLFVADVELCSYDGSRSITSTEPSNPGSLDSHHAADEPIIAPPTMTTS